MPPRRFSTGAGASQPKAHSPTPPNGPNTRRTTRNPTTVEEIEASQSCVTDTESAEKFLSTKLLCQEGQPYSAVHLSTILFHITQMSSATPLPVNTAIRAVAFLLKRHVAYEIAEVAAKHLSDMLAPRIVDHVIAAIAPQVATVHNASETLSLTITQAKEIHHSLKLEREEKEESVQIVAERIEEAADALFSSVEDCQNALKVLTPSLDATQDRINHLSTQMSMTTAPSAQASLQPTYSSIAASHLPPKVDQAVGRAAIRARQILLDPRPGDNLFPPDTPNADIAKKLKEAIINIRTDSTPSGGVRAITALRNGGIIVELENESLAAWLRGPIGRTLLEGQFETAISFRCRSYALVLEYLPVQTQIESEGFLHRVERENNLPTNSLVAIRWIKPTTRRSPGQCKAFALLQIAEAPIANDILRDGLCIANERISVRKDKKEPIRCAKCQGYGHIARGCSATTDTCGTCGEQHRTTQCSAYRTTRCVNCRSLTHTSWSRRCPEFIRRCELLDERYPENRMPYFPTETAWTHAVKPSKPTRTSRSPSASPAPTQIARNHALRQSTITFPPRSSSPPRLSPSPSPPPRTQSPHSSTMSLDTPVPSNPPTSSNPSASPVYLNQLADPSITHANV
jgi:hypothetical protein